MKENIKETLVKYSSVLRVPHSISIPVIKEFVYLCEKSGEEWTVQRYKMLKLDFIRIRAGLKPVSVWVAKKKDGSFTGPLGGLLKWAVRSDRNFDHSIQLLQMYSALVSDTVLDSQSKKFLDALSFDNISVNGEIFDHYNNLVMHAITLLFPLKITYGDPRAYVERSCSATRREPHADGSSYDEGIYSLECARSFLEGTDFGRGAVVKYPQLFGPLLRGIASHVPVVWVEDDGFPSSSFYLGPLERIGDDYNFPQNIVGKIGLIQEPGLKLRAVANPARVYQEVLKPLGDAIYGLLPTLPWDCTFDQNRPLVIIQDHLRKGQRCHAVDLSNATDRFPLEFQYRVLKRLFFRLDAVNLFYDLAKADWATELNGQGFVNWVSGQPLGLYPSFATFALTHGLMLYALNGFTHDNQFYVLGDDVVILNDQLYSKYIRFLNNMKLPYAESKTLSSTLLTEFGGKVILENRVIPQLKWRHVSDDSFLDLATHFGERFRYLMLPRQKAIFDLVKVLPVEMGGCGLNPTGIPLSDRIGFYTEVMESDTLQSYMLSYNRRIFAMNHEPLTARDLRYNLLLEGDLGFEHGNICLDGGRWYYPSNVTADFDQKSLALLNEKLHENLRKIAGSVANQDGLRNIVTISTCNAYGFSSISYRTSYKIDYLPLVLEQLLSNQLFRVIPRESGMHLVGGGVRKSTLSVLEHKLQEYL